MLSFSKSWPWSWCSITAIEQELRHLAEGSVWLWVSASWKKSEHDLEEHEVAPSSHGWLQLGRERTHRLTPKRCERANIYSTLKGLPPDSSMTQSSFGPNPSKGLGAIYANEFWDTELCLVSDLSCG